MICGFYIGLGAITSRTIGRFPVQEALLGISIGLLVTTPAYRLLYKRAEKIYRTNFSIDTEIIRRNALRALVESSV